MSCTVSADGAFHVSASGMDPQLLPPNSYIFLEIAGHAAPGAPLDATIYTVPTLEVRTEPGFPPCSVMAVRAAGARTLWASINCPALTSPERPTVACQASGEIVLESCGD